MNLIQSYFLKHHEINSELFSVLAEGTTARVAVKNCSPFLRAEEWVGEEAQTGVPLKKYKNRT